MGKTRKILSAAQENFNQVKVQNLIINVPKLDRLTKSNSSNKDYLKNKKRPKNSVLKMNRPQSKKSWKNHLPTNVAFAYHSAAPVFVRGCFRHIIEKKDLYF